jgi:hypothetical protein
VVLARSEAFSGDIPRGYYMLAKFSLGTLVITPSAMAEIQIAEQLPTDFLRRHIKGDWGDLEEDDKTENELSLKQGGRLMSCYRTLKDVKIWIITEADRSSTCILVPSDY